MFLQIVTLFAVTLSVQGDDSHAISEQKVVIRHQPPNHNSRTHYGQKKVEHHEEYAQTYPSYEFSYKISDPDSKDMKGQHESRDGDKVKGTYWLVEPTGHKRTVKYSSDDDQGFKAKIRYSAIRKPHNESKNNKNKKQNKDGQNASNELTENNNEQNEKVREQTMNQQVGKMNKGKPIQTDDVHRAEPQVGEQLQNNGFEHPDENNEDLSQEVDSNTSKTKISDNLNSNEEMGGSIGAEADREVKQIRHHIHKIYHEHSNGHNNDRKKDPKARDENRVGNKGGHENYGSSKQTDNKSIKPVFEEINDTDEKLYDDKGQLGNNNIVKCSNNKQNEIKSRNKAKALSNADSPGNKSDNQSNKEEANENVSSNNNKSHRNNANLNQGQTKRHKENHKVGSVRNTQNKDQGIQNKVTLNYNQHMQTEEMHEGLKDKLNNDAIRNDEVSEENKKPTDNAKPIINVKNSKNSNEARINYYKQLHETHNIKHKKSNKQDNTEEEVFEHHIVVYHS